MYNTKMKTFGSNTFLIIFPALCIVAVTGLECYQCTNSDEDSCSATTTCSAGQVCSNKVFQRYTLTTIYDKDCMKRSDCYSLEDLNTDRYCSTTPSTCTYCCGSNLCNGAESNTFIKTTLSCCKLLTLVITAALWSSGS